MRLVPSEKGLFYKTAFDDLTKPKLESMRAEAVKLGIRLTRHIKSDASNNEVRHIMRCQKVIDQLVRNKSTWICWHFRSANDQQVVKEYHCVGKPVLKRSDGCFNHCLAGSVFFPGIYWYSDINIDLFRMAFTDGIKLPEYLPLLFVDFTRLRHGDNDLREVNLPILRVEEIDPV